MIARALNSHPTTIILDEATAALDSQTEKLFFESFLSAFKGTTRIIIAHTATAMKAADQIIMLESVFYFVRHKIILILGHGC